MGRAGSKAGMFEKMEAGFGLPPIVPSGSSVFVSSEYAKAIGIDARTARERLMKLVEKKQVRRVREKTVDGIRSAWEYLGTGEGA